MPKKKKKNRSITFKKLLKADNYINSEAIRRHLPFLLFLFFLTMVYIWNSHLTGKVLREIGKKDKEIKRLRWELMTTESHLMNLGKQSKLATIVDSLGLEELKSPPKIIKVKL